MADIRTYSHNDIQRYLQHKMTPQEMHDFEKALMNDPFLADALEGFSSADAAVTEKHLIEIESELTGQKQEGKVVPMPLQKTAWWKVAAVVLVLATGGAVTYSLFTKTGAERNVAQQTAPAKAEEMATKTDSIGPVEKPLAKVEILPRKELFNKHKKLSPIIREEKEVPVAMMQQRQTKADSQEIAMAGKSEESSALMNKNTDANTALNAPVASSVNGEIELKKMASSSAVSEYEFEGRIVDTSNKPLAGATISVSKSNVGITPDSNGYFTLKAKDSVLQINVNAIGYAPTEHIIKRNSPVKIVLGDRTQSLSEVVVSALSQKKRKSDFRQLKENTKKDAEPEGGWKNFEEYLNRQVDSLKANDINNYYDEKIELEFSIDKEGRPTDIKALESADSLTAEKAIQILTNGPKWKNKKKDKKVKIIIPF